MNNNMDSQQIESMIKEFLTERFDVPAEKMRSDVSMRELGLDSIIMLDVMLEAEDRLGIKLSDLSMPADPKLHNIVELIQRNIVPGK